MFHIKNNMKHYIYKIISSKSDKIYIGSTNNKYRYLEHMSRYKRGMCSETSRYLFDLGVEYCSFHILEEFDVETFSEQLDKEQFYLDQYKDIIINKNRAKKHPEYRKIHYQKNKEKKQQ